MTHLVEQLLTLSRLEYQQNPQQQAVDLEPLLRQITAEQVPLAIDKDQNIQLDVSTTDNILGQTTGLEILARNLIDNAIRYTPNNGNISISLQQIEKQVVLEVCDDGPGIPDADKSKVLQRFYRLNHQQIQGSGLGLAIVKEISDQHSALLELKDTNSESSGLCLRVAFNTENS